jgi:hypothetical protein
MSEVIKPADAFPKVREMWIHMATDEWGNRLMQMVAETIINKDATDKPPLIVHVHEHAGWSMSFAKFDDGTVGSYHTSSGVPHESSPGGRFWQRQYHTTDREHSGDFRRDDTRVLFADIPIGGKFMASEWVWEKIDAKNAKKIPFFKGDEQTKEFDGAALFNVV